MAATQTGASLDDPIVAWVVRFDLPFMISVEDSHEDAVLRKWAEDPDKVTPPAYSPRLAGRGIVLGNAYHLPDPDALAEPIEVILDARAVRLRFLRRVRNVDVPIVMSGELRPCYGQSSFTSVRAELDQATSGAISEMADARAVAIEALNRFLEAYRFHIGAFWAQPIGVDTVTQCEFDTFYASGKVMDARSEAKPLGGPLRGFGNAPLISEDVESKIRVALTDPSWHTTMAYEVLLLARDHLVRGRFRNSVVDSATAFEVFLADFIRGLASQRGVADADVDRLMRREDGRWKDVSDLAKKTLRELDVNFAGTAECQRWDQDVRRPRNDFVHGSRTTATAETAQRAINAAEAAVAMLRKLAPAL